MARYYEEQTVLNAVCRGCNEEFSDEPCEPSECLLLREIKNLSTADVVPKNEVERLTVELAAMRGAANSYKMHYENLAREIFEEIEKYNRSPLPECKPVYILKDGEFAELKNKYTEGEK